MTDQTHDALALVGLTEASDDPRCDDESHVILRPDLTLETATKKAVLLRAPEQTDSTDEGYWIPKSVLRLDSPHVLIARWFVEKEGIDELIV